jgi:hypothetical protein
MSGDMVVEALRQMRDNRVRSSRSIQIRFRVLTVTVCLRQRCALGGRQIRNVSPRSATSSSGPGPMVKPMTACGKAAIGEPTITLEAKAG